MRDFSERADSYEATLFRETVARADPEVDELAIILEKARRRIYWRVEKKEKWPIS